MNRKSFWHSISGSVLILIWTVYYYGMRRTGGVADKTDAVICGIAGFLCTVVIAKKTIEFLKTHKGK